MLRILSSCSANVRRSFQVLDYTAAAGAKSFDYLCILIERKEEKGNQTKLQ